MPPPADGPVSPVTPDDFRLLVDSVADYAIFLLDPSGRVLSWNLGARRIEGYETGEIIGQHFSKFYTAGDVAAGKPERELKVARQESRVEDEGWRVRKDGTPFWANVVTTALYREDGSLRGFCTVVRDLTQRRASDAELWRSEQRFHQLIDAVADYSIFMLDPTGHVATWNLGARRTKGYEASEIIGQHFSVFYTPEDRAINRPERILQTVRDEGRFEEEGFRVRKDGTRFWASVVITTLRDEAGQAIGFAKITRDLTERRANEQQLRQSEERLRLLVESVSDYAIYMLSPTGIVQTWNQGAQRLKGYSAAEIIGSSFELFFTPEDRRLGKPARELELAASNGHFQDEAYRIRKDGTELWANVVLTAIRGDRGELLGFAKVTQDLTARREAEETVRQLTREQVARALAEQMAREAEEANRIKDEFLATVSHELRTPLNAIVGWTSILRQRPLEPNLSKALEIIDRNAHAQVKIIEDILDVSRVITGKLRIDPKPADLVAIIQQAIEVVRHSVSAKQLRLEFPLVNGTCPLVGDADRIQQVAWNLLSNAVKFTPAGGIIRVDLERTSTHVTLSVSDTGLGMDAELLPYLFDRFKQGDSSTTRRYGGLGLGLALVRHIAELHGGSVAATSPGLGKGSTVSVSLPLQVDEAILEKERAMTPVPPSTRRGIPLAGLNGMRILLVEDEPDARELVRAVLLEAGANVEAAPSAAAAFALLGSFKPQLMVSDIGMPDEDGYSLMRRIRALGAERGGTVPSVALTAYTRAEDRTKALAAGFTTHIGKPVNPIDLIAALGNLAALSRR